MLNRGIFYSVIFAILVSGCNEPNSNSGTSTFNGTQIEENNTQSSNVQAVRLYVDAMMLNDIQQWDQALQKLTSAIEFAPDFSLAWSFKGDIYQNNEQYEKSADSYEQATKVDPWSFNDFSNLGKVCQLLEDFARAVKAYVSACELNTTDFDVHLGAARCFYELNDYELAFGYGQRATEINPNMGEAEVLIGDIYTANENQSGAKVAYKKAVAAYRRVLEAEGNEPTTMVALAVAYTKLEHFDSAEELLQDAIDIDPKSSTAFQYLGFVQLQLHNDDLSIAMESYKKAVEVDEKDFMAHKGLGVVYMLKFMQGGQKDEDIKQQAVVQWNESLTLKPDQADLKELIKKCTAPQI